MKRIFHKLIEWVRFVFGPQPQPAAEQAELSEEALTVDDSKEPVELVPHSYKSKALCIRLENIAASLNRTYKTNLKTEDIMDTCQALGIGWYIIEQSKKSRRVVAPEDATRICAYLSRRIIKINTI